jgi:Domain of unknown function (DUF4136)
MRNKKKALILQFLVIALSASAALAAEVKSDYDRSYSLERMRSFSFVAQTKGSSVDALAGDELAAKRVQNAIELNLIAAGLSKDQNADFTVSYRAVLRNQAQVSTSGFPRLGAGRVWVDSYTVGTVIVEFRDAKSGDLVWRGLVSDTVDANKGEEKINNGIKKLITRFAKDREKQQAGKK